MRRVHDLRRQDGVQVVEVGGWVGPCRAGRRQLASATGCAHTSYEYMASTTPHSSTPRLGERVYGRGVISSPTYMPVGRP